MAPLPEPIRVTLIATPDAQVAPLSGLYETLTAFRLLAAVEPEVPEAPFEVEIAAPAGDTVQGASGLTLTDLRSLDEIGHTDIAIVPLMMVEDSDWVPGRYPGVVTWLRDRHDAGALLASACTGVLLLAETGLLDGWDATIHWAFAPTFRRNFPDVRLRPREVLVTAGDHEELVMSGGVMSWHDLALHLIARHVGPSAAQGIARMLMLEWHGEGQAPYIAFAPSLDHGDAVVARLQRWLAESHAVANPVDEMVERSGVARRTLERRFRKATGHSPIRYVQNLRIAEARRSLERTGLSVERIARSVGYENTAYFTRLFRRVTRLTPGAYRRKFRGPRTDRF
ncbi:MAG: helix-turn-helix domain-containing protein [Gemmatimonadota bacterium]|jgi:transcriptional regulator GlxA family with amidase domain